MKLRISTLCFISAFATFFTAIAFAENTNLISSPKHAQNRSEFSGLFENKYGFAYYWEIATGIYKSDGLGTNLPKGLIAKDLARLLAPNEDLSLAILVGAKAFPYRLNSYVTIVCFAKNEYEYRSEMTSSDKSCDKKSYRRDDVVYLGLVEYDSIDSKPKLIANPLKIETGWHFISQRQFRKSNAKFRFLDPTNNALLPYGKFREFDFAPFQISNTQTAFGLRVGMFQGYSGGGGYYEVLALFLVDNGQIVNILAEPIYFWEDQAGDWNKDGTRQHYLYEGENILVVLPSQTDGYYDLQLKALDNEWERTFLWDASLKRYLPSDRTATLNRVLAETLNLRVD
ncbi:hypothetical protein H6F42_05375 [Pseudanabaena sp. FACHB-1998]|uniref:hypothetical protein n=1 Tax=Pseudanabaena sp. FACHB-1998 TaxID=2692858 RepID=UPI0016801E9F|nr:hypothetical protein [Pseudanabaena sp. FACHB-1998]MBD2176349.1 hypothetical protein [Pseudanabaena sp. FACHB-1998]